MEILDIAQKIALVLIAFFNAGFAVYIFRQNRKKDESKEERDRRINLLKILVFDYNLSHLYKFFDDVESETKKLLNVNLQDREKKEINDKILQYERELENKFINLLIPINEDIFNSIKTLIDNMTDKFTRAIFDEGINLYVEDKFNDVIYNRIVSTKKDVIKVLFNYKGE
jgi:hypothetical protein